MQSPSKWNTKQAEKMRSALGFVCFGLCLGEFFSFGCTIYSLSASTLGLAAICQWFMTTSFNVFHSSRNQNAIHWDFPWHGRHSRGRRCDAQVLACWWCSRPERCHKLCLVLKQWVSRGGKFLLIFPPLFLLVVQLAEICFIFIFLFSSCLFIHVVRRRQKIKKSSATSTSQRKATSWW